MTATKLKAALAAEAAAEADRRQSGDATNAASDAPTTADAAVPPPPKLEITGSPTDVKDVAVVEQAPKLADVVVDVMEANGIGSAKEQEQEQVDEEIIDIWSDGACTTTFLATAAVTEPEKQHSWIELLDEMQTVMAEKGHAQVPQLSTSRQIDLNEPFSIMKPGSTKHKALIIGINYTYQGSELSGCHRDALNLRQFALRSGYADENIIMLLDRDGYMHPTADNMRGGFLWLVDGADKDTSLFLSYSGHGTQRPDHSGDEIDGYDEMLCPVDCHSAGGYIADDELFQRLVVPLPEGCELTVFMDCCHAGSMLDLPYTFMGTAGLISDVEAGRVAAELGHNPNFNVSKALQIAQDMYGLRKYGGASLKEALSFGSRAVAATRRSSKRA